MACVIARNILQVKCCTPRIYKCWLLSGEDKKLLRVSAVVQNTPDFNRPKHFFTYYYKMILVFQYSHVTLVPINIFPTITCFPTTNNWCLHLQYIEACMLLFKQCKALTVWTLQCQQCQQCKQYKAVLPPSLMVYFWLSYFWTGKPVGDTACFLLLFVHQLITILTILLKESIPHFLMSYFMKRHSSEDISPSNK